MHRAAAYGNGDDIRSLTAHGSSHMLCTLKLHWTPIFVAVRFKNISTFNELMRHTPPSFIWETDLRGWTLLHIAADVGNQEMIKLLLDLGACPHALSRPSSFLVPRGLENKSLTPKDIALNRGHEFYSHYINALKDTGFDIFVYDQEEEDIFWPAESKC